MEASGTSTAHMILQETELRMLKDVAAFCDAHGLRYFIYCGTLLGAVRHGGFIPWDDDADLCMPYEDYRKLIALRGGLKGYTVQTPETDRYHYVTWMKIFADGTTFMPASVAGYPCHHGISLDVYPILAAPSQPFLAKIRKNLFIADKCLLGSGYYRRMGHLRHPMAKAVARLPEWMTRSAGRLLWKLIFRDPPSKYVCTSDAAPFVPKFLRTDFGGSSRLRFEDTEFSAPADWDRMLGIMYGNYRELPPVWARVSHRETSEDYIVDGDRDYRLYAAEIAEERREARKNGKTKERRRS